jgi:hypothetical protein
MITRMYPNADGELQNVTLSAAEWEALSPDDLDKILGFGKPALKPELDPAPALKATKRIKK